MKAPSIRELTEHFLEEKRKGVGFSKIRKELERFSLDSDVVSAIIRNIDNKILQEVKIKSQNRKAKEIMYFGLVIFVIGIVITMGTYLNFIGNGDSFVLAYGPIIVGFGTFATGMFKLRRIH